MSKVCLFKKKLQKTVFGAVISSSKSHVLLSVWTLQNKVVVPASIVEHLNVKFLLANAAKHGRWVSYTFLQKPCSFKRFSILKENCVADINNVRLLLTNAAKNSPWVSNTFLQKPRSFKRFSILEENCGDDIINVTFKCKTFFNKSSKTCFWVNYTFLQKPSLFKHLWIWPSFSRNFFVCKINDFGEINIWRFWWRRNVMRKKIQLLIR